MSYNGSLFNTQDVFDAIVKHDRSGVQLILDTVDVNKLDAGISPLWVAITGDINVRQKATNKGNLKMIELVLDQGANPNIKCMTVPPIYIAVVEEDLDIISLLLNRGAYPNEYKVENRSEVVNSPGKYVNNCKLPLMYAIENAIPGAVEALLAFDCIFNKETITRAKKVVEIKNKIYRESNNVNNNDYITYRDAKDIVKMLEKEYDEYLHEAKAKKYMEENSTSYNNSETFFVGLQQINHLL
jgi:ankyrin repeat protein